MIDLPIELWHLIFDHLELTDLSSCARVGKQFYFNVKEYRIRELAFTRRIYQWFGYAPAYHKHQVDFTDASILERSSFNFEYLRSLKIGKSAIDLNDINRLTSLEKLDIDLKNYDGESRTLSLANLKALYVYPPDYLPFLEFYTPRLTELRTWSLSKLEFAHPESIRCIHTFYHNGKLSAFPNLEYLTFTDGWHILGYLYQPIPDEFSLAALRKLKEIEFYYYDHSYEDRSMSNLKEIVQNILNLKRTDLKVFWKQVQITDSNLLTKYEQMDVDRIGNLIVFQLQHYEKLKSKVDLFSCIGFNEGMNKLKKAGFNLRSEEFTSKLFTKYSFTQIIVTGPVDEPELLMQLIRRSSRLHYLEFSASGLDQSFFDQMAEIIRLNGIPLEYLYFDNSSGDELNYEFVCKLLDLQNFETDQPLSNGLVPKLLRIRSLNRILCEFRVNSYSLSIERLSANRFRMNGKALSLRELLEHFNSIPDSKPDSKPSLTQCTLM